MTFEEIKVGDVLYNDFDENKPEYLLVVWKNDKSKWIGGRYGNKLGDKKKSIGFRVDIGNSIEIHVNGIRNYNAGKEEKGIFYGEDKKYLKNCKVIAHLPEKEINLFNIISKYANTEANILISLKCTSDEMESNRDELLKLRQILNDIDGIYHNKIDEFLSKYYCELKEKSGMIKEEC